MARHCPECGFVVGEGANYCPKCGAYHGGEQQEAKGDDVTTATYVIDESTGELRPVDVGDVAAERRARWSSARAAGASASRSRSTASA